MRELVKRFGLGEALVIREYVKADKRDEVERKSNSHNINPRTVRPRAVE